jgi:lipopolysaccharide/colanic/teichoic acid biosynthesis glycosyltransferase
MLSNPSLAHAPAAARSAEGLEQFFARRLSAWKRGIDIIGALAGLVVFSPFFLLIAVVIKVVSPGPVFFKQARVGRGGRQFICWKFRTMQVRADPSVHQQHVMSLIRSGTNDGAGKPMVKLDSGRDPRLIPLGNILRQSCLDELPQLINVLRGEMSLVGPRPCLPYEAQEYLLWQTTRFDVAPGMTGLWQVSGKNRTTFTEMIRLDILYAKQQSLWLDISILLKTVPVIIAQIIALCRKRRADQGSTRPGLKNRQWL